MKSKLTEEQRTKLALIEGILDYQFKDPRYILPAITHPSATEGRSVKYSYERLEFLGDSIMGAIVSYVSFQKFPNLDEGGLTRIKVALVSGASLAKVAKSLGFADVIVFGSSEEGTGRRGMHSALENVYEAVVAALYLDGGVEAAARFIDATLTPLMTIEMARGPENPKSALQEKLQLDGITPIYRLVETVGPPHDRTFVTDVCAGEVPIARGIGRTKKEAESLAARTALERLDEIIDALREAVAAQRAAEEAAAAAEEAALEAAALPVRPCDIQWGLGWHLHPEELAPGFVWQFQLGESASAAAEEDEGPGEPLVPLADCVPSALAKVPPAGPLALVAPPASLALAKVVPVLRLLLAAGASWARAAAEEGAEGEGALADPEGAQAQGAAEGADAVAAQAGEGPCRPEGAPRADPEGAGAAAPQAEGAGPGTVGAEAAGPGAQEGEGALAGPHAEDPAQAVGNEEERER